MNMPAENLRIAERLYRDAQQAWYASLPDFPVNGRCSCGAEPEHGNWQVLETGYQRWTNASWEAGDEGEPDYFHASTDGWDDMSESGDCEWVECNEFNGGCGLAYKTPEIEWD